MKSTRQIEQSIKGFCVIASAHLDRRVRDDVQQIIRKSKQTESAAAQPNIWRIIMRSRIMKLAAAAVILIAAVIGLMHWPPRAEKKVTIPPELAQMPVEKLL
ncbi:MAG: hypothetical protein ACYTBJ_15050, partial [Planctomycetota bacterium]